MTRWSASTVHRLTVRGKRLALFVVVSLSILIEISFVCLCLNMSVQISATGLRSIKPDVKAAKR